METQRQCIVCIKDKAIEEFNEEHIFPASIGGSFTTDKVCKDCNTLLNQIVDEPFVKSNFVIKYRHDFNLNRDSNRGIPTITKKPVKNAEGDKVLLKFKDGKLKSEPIDKFSYKIHDDGKVECNLTIDPDKAHLKDEIIKKRLDRLSKKLNMAFGSYTITKEERNPTKEFSFVANVSNNLLIKECIKIAYETASIISPNYIYDDLAKKYVSYLLHDQLDEEFKVQIDEIGVNKFKKYNDRFNLFGLPLYHHGFFIENIPSEGVYVVIKIFSYLYPVLITTNCELFPKEEMLMSINVINGEIYNSRSIEYQLLSFNMMSENISKIIENNIKTLGIAYFDGSADSTFSFYNDKGNIKHKDINSLSRSVIIEDKPHQNPNTGHLNLDLVEKNMFVKTKDGLLIKLLNLTIVPKNVIQQLPK